MMIHLKACNGHFQRERSKKNPVAYQKDACYEQQITFTRNKKSQIPIHDVSLVNEMLSIFLFDLI